MVRITKGQLKRIIKENTAGEHPSSVMPGVKWRKATYYGGSKAWVGKFDLERVKAVIRISPDSSDGTAWSGSLNWRVKPDALETFGRMSFNLFDALSTRPDQQLRVEAGSLVELAGVIRDTLRRIGDEYANDVDNIVADLDTIAANLG